MRLATCRACGATTRTSKRVGATFVSTPRCYAYCTTHMQRRFFHCAECDGVIAPGATVRIVEIEKPKSWLTVAKPTADNRGIELCRRQTPPPGIAYTPAPYIVCGSHATNVATSCVWDGERLWRA